MLKSGIFPRLWKPSEFIIIPKGNLKDDPSTYRPICLLPIVGKSLEKIIAQRLNGYLYDRDIISENQHDLTLQKSTITALDTMIELINSAITNKQYTITFSLDIMGAFDNVRWNNVTFIAHS